MARKTITGKNFLWHHISKLGAEDAGFLRDEFQLHQVDLESLDVENAMSRAHVRDNYLFAVFLSSRFGKNFQIESDELFVFMSSSFLITISKRNIESVESLFSNAERNPKFRNELLSRGAGHVLCKLARGIFNNAQTIVSDLCGHEVQACESVRTRRDLLSARLLIDSQKKMANAISGASKQYISSDLQIYFDDLRDKYDSLRTRVEVAIQSLDCELGVKRMASLRTTNRLIILFMVTAVVLTAVSIIADVIFK